MERVLLKRIVVPVAIASVIMFLLHWALDWHGTFLSLGANLVTLLVSVLYVDVVMRRAKAAEEIPAEERVRRRLQMFINGIVTACRTAFGYGSDVIDSRKVMIGDHEIMHAEMMRIAQQIIEPTAHRRIHTLGRKEWATFAENMRLTSVLADTILSTLGSRMAPDVFAAVLDVQNEVNGIWTLYVTWPDILGVPDDELPPKRNGDSSLPLKMTLTELAADNISKLIESIRVLSEAGQLTRSKAHPAA